MKRVIIVEIDNAFLVDLYFAQDEHSPTQELLRRTAVPKGKKGALEDGILALFRMRPRPKRGESEQPDLPGGES